MNSSRRKSEKLNARMRNAPPPACCCNNIARNITVALLQWEGEGYDVAGLKDWRILRKRAEIGYKRALSMAASTASNSAFSTRKKRFRFLLGQNAGGERGWRDLPSEGPSHVCENCLNCLGERFFSSNAHVRDRIASSRKSFMRVLPTSRRHAPRQHLFRGQKATQSY